MVIVFTFASVFFYRYYFEDSKYNKTSAAKDNMNDIPNSSGNGTIELHMYYVTWCPYCKTALPVVNGLKEKYDGKILNSKYVTFTISDITDTSENQFIVDKYNIKSYPTIFIVDNGKRVDYKAKVTNENLEKFLNSV